MRLHPALPLVILVALVTGLGAGPRQASAQGTPEGSPAASPVVATPAPLDERTLSELMIFPFPAGEEATETPVRTLAPTIQLMPGMSAQLALGVIECCYVFFPAPAQAIWSVEPAGAGATIDPVGGFLSIGLSTPADRVFTVSADVENGRRVVTAEVYLFTANANPFVGVWREVAQLTCDTGAEVEPDAPIRELIFNADGTFAATWTPFEVYVDFWGRYTFDAAEGTIELEVEDGNAVPPDIDGSGRYAFDEMGNLVLTDLWLGQPSRVTSPANCGHRFVSLMADDIAGRR